MILPEGITRKYILGIGDLLIVSNPGYIRLLNEHDDIGRPDMGQLPTTISVLLSATQFRTPHFNNGEYCVPYTSSGHNDYRARHKRTTTNLNRGFTDTQLRKISQLVWSDLSESDVAAALVKLVGPTVIGLKPGINIPDDIVEAMSEMDLAKLFSNPLQYFRARSARRQIEKWVEELEQFQNEEHVIDIVHDLVNVYLGFTRGLVTLRNMKDNDDLESFLSSNPILPVSARTPLRDTTVGGLFEGEPLRKDQTVIVMKNGEAAKETGNIEFVFGMGGNVRQCPFKHLFLSTCKEVVDEREGS